jgi:ubiquinone/menaquinone biosynthesis C-methylase UbiE
MVNVLHGFVLNGEILDVMREIVRVTKRHSSLTIVDFKKIQTVAGPPASQRLSPAEVENLLGEFGLVAEKFDDVGPYSYLINFIRR